VNAIKLSAIVFVLLLVVVVLAAVAPCLVQDATNNAVGNGNSAVSNIKQSLDNTNDALEDGPIGDFFDHIDNNN
jgi:hypothetical protein